MTLTRARDSICQDILAISRTHISKSKVFQTRRLEIRFQVRKSGVVEYLGYSGYIPGANAENMYGKTFGKITYDSSTGTYDKGIDLPADKKFVSTLHKEFVDQSKVEFEAAAKIVGVNKLDDTYQRPIDPHTLSKFWGTSDRDDIASAANLEKNRKVFYGCDKDYGVTYDHSKKSQTEAQATTEFYNVKNKSDAHFAPIPGYSGVSRRVGADNIFGMTYAEARRCADESQTKICEEKGETLKTNYKFVPEYNRPQAEEYLF